MLLTLTDHLACPRCGPTAGLIVLIEEVRDRRVRRGSLGCPICRARYPIAARVADLRGEAQAPAPAPAPAPAQAQAQAQARPALPDLDATRLAGLLGVAEGQGFVLVDGPRTLSSAAALADLIPDLEIVVPIAPDEADRAAELPLSAILDSGVLPVRDGAMWAVAAVGAEPGSARLAELVRVCRPKGRLVVELGAVEAEAGAGAGAGAGAALDRTAARLEAAGATVRARDDRGLVASVG